MPKLAHREAHRPYAPASTPGSVVFVYRPVTFKPSGANAAHFSLVRGS